MRSIILTTILLTLIGALFVFESSVAESLASFGNQYHFAQSHLIRLVIGYILLLAGALVPTSFWKKTAWLWYGLGILTLVLVLIPGIGREFNGARRWLSIPGLGVMQPIEFAKLTLIIFFASWMSKHQRILPFIFLTGLPILLVILQPDLGSTLSLFAISIGMYFAAGGNWKWILSIGALGGVLASAAILTSDYRRDRVMTFLNPELDPLGSSFHVRQITLALGRGGMFGQGIGNSKQKLEYIPEASSDSIFAITAEEVGFLGSTFIIALYALYLRGGFKIVNRHPPGSFEFLLGTGFLVWIGTQTALNLAAVVALIPLTGIPLPFFSYGGSSLVMVLLATGILLSLRKAPKKKS